MRRFPLVLLALVPVVALSAPGHAGAQLPEPRAAASWRRIAGFSPAHLLFGSLAGDYEQAWTRDVSLGVGATYSDANAILTSTTSGGYDLDVSAKVRYYLTGTAPVGTSVGLVAGFVQGRRERRGAADPTLPAAQAQFAPTLGFTFDVNRAVGSSRRVILGTGYGIKRRYVRAGGASAEYEEFAHIQGTLRVLFGYAW